MEAIQARLVGAAQRGRIRVVARRETRPTAAAAARVVAAVDAVTLVPLLPSPPPSNRSSLNPQTIPWHRLLDVARLTVTCSRPSLARRFLEAPDY